MRPTETKQEQDIAWLKSQVKELENRVASLEKNSHPPADLRPMMQEIIDKLPPPVL